MKATDYIIEFLTSKGVTDIFGYPGGVVCHFMDSLYKYSDNIRAHITYHEQGAAFAACGYALAKGLPGVAYATSGPGATNLITGIANAYYDSTPTIFFTGQVDTYGLKGKMKVRQRGFQETEVVSIVESITKYAVRVDNVQDIPYFLEKAWWCAVTGRKGPVLLDLPADVQRGDIYLADVRHFIPPDSQEQDNIKEIYSLIEASKRPCVLVGAGIKQTSQSENTKKFLEKWGIPAVFSLPAFDVLPKEHKLNMGYIGTNGHRYGNFIIGKCDLLITLGSRLELKQVGNNRKLFAQNARIVRIDIDEGELEYKVHDDEIVFKNDLNILMPALASLNPLKTDKYSEWEKACSVIKERLNKVDFKYQHYIIADICAKLPSGGCITADVGQHELWTAQAAVLIEGQHGFLSAGHGAMGFSLPAAIGVYYATGKPVIAFTGDGGLQMNIQELQFISRENIPVIVVVLNNNSLGMIRQFQDANFEKRHFQTTSSSGYLAPNYRLLAEGYGLTYSKIQSLEEVGSLDFDKLKPQLIEVILEEDTVLEPKFGKDCIYDQEPLIDRVIFEELEKMIGN